MSLSSAPASVNHAAPVPAQLPLFPDDAPLVERWRKVPNAFAQCYRDAGLTHAQACLVTNIRSRARRGQLPAPALSTVALDLRTDVRQVQRWLADLRGRGLVVVHERRGVHGGQLASAYDFAPLFRLCEEIAAAKRAVGAVGAVDTPGVPAALPPLALGGEPVAAAAPATIAACPPSPPSCVTHVSAKTCVTSLAPPPVDITPTPPVENTTPIERGTNVPRQRRQIDPPTPTERRVEPRSQERIGPEAQALAGPAGRVAAEFGDGAPLLATVRQFDRLRAAHGLAASAFLTLVEEARWHVRGALDARRRRRTLAPIANRMGYYLATLEQLCAAAAVPPEAPPPPRHRRRRHGAAPDVPESCAGAAGDTPTSASPPSDPPDAWAAITAEAAQVVTPENVARWFLPGRLVADAGDELRVAVPDEFHRRWLGERLRGKVEGAAARVRPGLRVVFEVEGLRG